MKKTIFTLAFAILASLGLIQMNAQDVHLLNFSTSNFEVEGINGATATVAQAPDGTDAIKVELNSEAGWNGVATITLDAPFQLGEYVSIKYDVYVDVDQYMGYMKFFDNADGVIEGWGTEQGDGNAWYTSSLGLLVDQVDGSAIRRTGTIAQLLIIPGKGWNTNNEELNGKTAYYANFRVEKGENTPPKEQFAPTVFWKSYVATSEIKMDGDDRDNAWDDAAEEGIIEITSSGLQGGEFYSVWDSQKFYLFCNITDGNEVVTPRDNTWNASWMGDGIQFYFDVYNRHFVASQADQLNGAAIVPYMTDASASNPEITIFQAEQGGLGDYARGLELGSVVGPSSYKMEIGIPWEAFYNLVYPNDHEKIAKAVRDEIKAGKKVAIAIQINDYDPVSGSRVAAISTPSAEGIDIYGKPMYWAEMELVGNGTPYYNPDYINGGPATGIKNVQTLNVNVFNILGYFNIVGENLKSVEVYNIGGQKIFSDLINGDAYTVPSGGLAKGIYLVKVTDNNNLSVTKKIIK